MNSTSQWWTRTARYASLLCALASASSWASTAHTSTSVAQASSGAKQESIAGVITHVADGDTLDITVGQRVVRIRLEGIDAPEHGQPFGNRATTYLRTLAFSQRATVHVKQTDRYGRLVARVFVAGRDLSEEMVRAGLAWHYTDYSSDPRLAALEKEARASHIGLWADRAPVPPWTARRARATGAAPAPRTAGGPPSSSSAGSVAERTTAPQASGPYHGNVKSHVYHAPGCRDYSCANCRAVFASRAEAEAAGYRPHADCVNRR